MIDPDPRAVDLAILRGERDRRNLVRRFDWSDRARPSQRIPEGAWRAWLVMAGRGFGKTRVGAETVRIWSESNPRVNLIGRTIGEARELMIDGPSGILNVFPPWERPEWIASRRLIRYPSGARGTVFTSDEPDGLRGPEHHKIWADEVASWIYPRETWDMAMFGLRQGPNPQIVATTTPKPIELIRELTRRARGWVAGDLSEADLAKGRIVLTSGTTYENRDNLNPEFLAEILGAYEGTRIGRQEILAEVLDDVVGALWTTAMIDPWRLSEIDRKLIRRSVVAIDPAATHGEDSDETGIIAFGSLSSCPFPHREHPLDGGLDSGKGGCYVVLGDHSGRYSPNEWASRALDLADTWGIGTLVGEVNNGGEMVAQTVRNVRRNVRILQVHASQGKAARAEPVVGLYEQGRVHHVGKPSDLAGLEDEMVVFPVTGDHDDRVDALVYGGTYISQMARSVTAY